MIKRLTIWLILNSIGPILSFYSLQTQLNYSWKIALTYSIATYFVDLIVVVIFAYFLNKLVYKNNFSQSLTLSLKFHYFLWIFDIFDIYQPLRILSNIWLLVWFFYLRFKLKNIKFDKFVIIIVTYLILYGINSLIAESIAPSNITTFFAKI